MAGSDDEDAYLYGSDDENEQPVTKKQKTAPSKEPEPISQKADEDDDEDDDDEDESSDDDIDIVIGDPTSKTSSAVTTTGTSSAGPDKDANTTTIVSNNQTTEALDINKMAELDGKPLTAVDLETLKDKPWRIPGADITDYFNYGFDEFTWTAYCHKQDKTRGEFNPQKLMAKLMGSAPPGPPGGGMPPMPPMGMMPMGMMGGMPPMPPNFNPGNGFGLPPPPPPPKK